MPTFYYEGRNRYGKRVKGKQKAQSEQDARDLLKENKVIVMQLKELDSWLYKEVNVARSVKAKDFIVYLRQFSTLLKAGVTIVDANDILAEQTESKALKRVLRDVSEELRAGNRLSEAAEKHPRVFPTMFTNMMRAGEAGGNLDEILERLADDYEKQFETRQKMISAVSYPAVVAAVALVIVSFLLTFVVPSFTSMFADFDSELPWITTFVLTLGEGMQRFWWLMLLVVVGVGVGLFYARRSERGRWYFDYWLLKIPIVGPLVQRAILARMARTFSALLASSVPILQATMIVERIVQNEIIASVIREIRASLEKGDSMTVPMEKHWIFPSLVTQMVRVGEKSGVLDEMLAKVADFYEAEVDHATDRMKTMLEPLLIVVLSVVVGVIVASIAIPMFEIFDSVG
ncbi:type II secretion system F family protein [Texcoconibacillus texcoconensis]|uniref:Type IV pilus assembly protein PilC n=1 Tax=Texcoconibacillus texcoconensis TaxID=1095777 RepID=A0A840QT02_9BACI|nr:type II secretion system F family protein [Texcoconibacillus texcoconensis]MBB5174397.1 type IV pilus assembly protein PilC [Texcoconibacillus texcoconensis]